MDKEIWRSIPNYEGLYEISSFGNVRSLDRYIERPANRRSRACTIFLQGKMLRPGMGTNGYYLVVLSKNGITKQYMVHLLVADVFLGREKHTSLVVNHINGIKTDNHITNLELVTVRENSAHAYATGLIQTGYDSARTKLTLSQVQEIQELAKCGYSNSCLAAKYNVSRTTIFRAVHYVYK